MDPLCQSANKKIFSSSVSKYSWRYTMELLGVLLLIVCVIAKERVIGSEPDKSWLSQLSTKEQANCVKCVSGPMFYVILGDEKETPKCLPFPSLNPLLVVRHYVLHPGDCGKQFVKKVYTPDSIKHHKAGELNSVKKYHGSKPGKELKIPKPPKGVREQLTYKKIKKGKINGKLNHKSIH